MSYSLLVHASQTSTGASTGATTSAIDTTGADLLVACLSSNDGIATLSDSKSNTWTPLTMTIGGAPPGVRLYYCRGGTVGTGHTFSSAGVSQYSSVAVAAFSGAHATPFDAENGSNGSGGTQATGSVTPSEAGELIIAGLAFNSAGSPLSIDAGFTIAEDANYVAGQSYGVGLAYLIQGAAAGVNPTWTRGGSSQNAAAIATFKAAAAAAAAMPRDLGHTPQFQGLVAS